MQWKLLKGNGPVRASEPIIEIEENRKEEREDVAVTTSSQLSYKEKEFYAKMQHLLKKSLSPNLTS